MSGDSPILIAVLEYGELPEMLRVAEILRSLGRSIVFFFVKSGYRRLDEDGALISSKGMRWIDAAGREGRDVASRPADPVSATRDPSGDAGEPKPKAASRKNGLFARTGSWLGLRETAIDLLNFMSDLRRLRARSKSVRQIVDRESPALVVTGQSAIGSELDMVLLAARQRACPTIIVPFAMFNFRELAMFAVGQPAYHVASRPLNRLLARVFPRWAVEYDDKKLVRLPGSRALAVELAGLAESHPWIPCSAPVSALACESQATAQRFVEMGIEPARLVVVGGAVHDRLAGHIADRSGRRRLLEEAGLPTERPVLVCGWPANVFAWVGERLIAYPDYPALARSWAALLKHVVDEHRWNVLVSIHPKTLEAEIEPARDAGLSIYKDGAERLIAHGDAFCTLNGSSITAWAIACAKPVVLFDCYATGYTDFDGVEGVVTTSTERQFREALDQVCTNEAVRSKLGAIQAKVAEQWGVLDGHSERRLTRLASRLLNGSPADAPLERAPA